MENFSPLKELPEESSFSSNDIMVVFGEVFASGYVNGIIDQAQAKGMKIIYSTVGRRDENLNLRPLNEEEIQEKGTSPLVNIPLEAGFDLEKSSAGISPVDQLKSVKMSSWKEAELDFEAIEECREQGSKNFRARTTEWVNELEALIPEGANVIFVHTMAGGFPRSKIVMSCANRVFKGTGARFSSSKEFWESSIGRLCEICFNEVTGETFKHLIDLTTPLRERVEGRGNKVNYVAYGYHGNQCLIGGEYSWQSYAPYLQGWAKIRLEEIALEAWQNDVKATVFNVPEILTNSSSIFLGVEVALYPLITSLKEASENSPYLKGVLKECSEVLAEGKTLDHIVEFTQSYLKNETIQSASDFETWPQHNSPEQMELMQTTSKSLIEMHRDPKALSTALLSEVIFRACGKIMLDESQAPRKPVWWIGHDTVTEVAKNFK